LYLKNNNHKKREKDDDRREEERKERSSPELQGFVGFGLNFGKVLITNFGNPF
jgi:hypothetical protein